MSDAEHYKQRLRALLPYATHKNTCEYAQWQVGEFLQKQRGENYSAGPAKPCTCNLAALAAIIQAEVEN